MSQAIDGIIIENVNFSYYPNEIAHGIVMKIIGTKSLNIEKRNISLRFLSMNIFGKFWDSLPSGVGQIVQWTYLPLSMYNYIKDINILERFSDSEKFEIILHFGTKENQFGIKHSTIENQLNKLINNGDAVIELLFLDYKTEVFSIYTKPSLIQESLKQNSQTPNSKLSAVYTGPIPKDIRTGNRLPKVLRWVFLPVLFSILVWISMLKRDEFNKTFPPIIFRPEDKISYTESKLIPPHPRTMSQSWNASRLEYEYSLQEASITPNQTRMKEILFEIGRIVGRNYAITPEEMHLIYERIIEVENDTSIAQKIYGCFTFINAVWLIAILGITFSFGPAIWILLKPLRRGLLHVGKIIWNYIVIPLHSWGVFEVLFFVLCGVLIIDSYKFNKTTGYFIAVTGIFLGIPSYIYSFILHSPYSPSKSTTIFSALWGISIFLPITLHYESYLLAWIIVIAFYSCIGFSDMMETLCLFIGFTDDDSVLRVALTSLILQSLFAVFRFNGISYPFVRLFQCPVMTLGSIVLFVALLIFSSIWFCYCHYENNPNLSLLQRIYRSHLLRQLPILTALVISLFCGEVWNFPGMINTVYTFAIFYGIQKFDELHLDYNWNGWVLVLINSVMLYYIALFLHRNPGFVVEMFTFSQE